MNINFSNEFPLSRTDEIVDYLSGPRLWIPKVDYPDYDDWLQKVYRQLRGGEKRAIIAMDGRTLMGTIIYQKHQTLSDTLEIKNLTVRPDKQGRYIASFLLRNAEVEGSHDFKTSLTSCDTKKNNFAVRMFLFKNGYIIKGEDDLYKLNSGNDIVFGKNLYNNFK